MTLKEMQSIAAGTLALFIQTIHDVPFAENDIVIEFTPKRNYVERFEALCAQYAPDRPINDAHRYALENVSFANAIIGREKSAVVLKIDYRIDEESLRRIVFHELMHIYCGKTEMDAEHFIDVFGSGHTPDPDPEDTTYDGYLSAGYFVWNEFIAEYFATVKTGQPIHMFVDIADYVCGLLGEICVTNAESKTIFAMTSAYILTCGDIDGVIDEIDGLAESRETGNALKSCLRDLYDHVRTEKPWKITEEFIADFGCKYLTFTMLNSF